MRDTAYFVTSPSGPGPGVLLLHSWWGLDGSVRRFADRLADLGYTVLAPDLTFGKVFGRADEASAALAEADPDRLAGLTLASVGLVRSKSADPDRPVAVVGLSMGASLGLWASVRRPDDVTAVVAFYGAQSIDFDGSLAAYQLHTVEDDPYVSADEAAFMEATIGLAGRPVQRFTYPGVSPWFMEEGRPGFDPVAAALGWDRLSAFLSARLPV